MSIIVDPENLIVTKRLSGNDGFTYTLTSRLGNMLADAELLYGPRDKEYTILGIEFYENGPQVWFPGKNQGRKDIIIQLGSDVLQTSEMRACWQMAHECIHLLAPNGGGIANRLEEGMATYFSRDYIQRNFKQNLESWESTYRECADLVRDLLLANPSVIRILRRRQPAIYKVTANDILWACPGLSRQKAEWLVQPAPIPRSNAGK